MTRIALFQATSSIDPADNAARLEAAIARAADGGAAMLFTPEMSGLLDRDAARSAAHLRGEADDPVLARVREAARRHAIWVHLGSLALASGEADGRRLNRGLVIDPSGTVRARYDKIHLFDVDLGNESWRESAVYRPGAEATLVRETPVGALGLTICYDLRFPALFSALAEAGADAIAVPAAFTVPTGQAHWEVLLRARAIEAGLFVIAAAQAGHHADGRVTYGHSLVVDPWGTVLLDMGEDEGVGFADLDPERIAEVRARIPALRHRRPVAAPGEG